MMVTPTNRKEFERNLDMLSESMLKGNFHLPPDRRMINSILSARNLPNNRVNFLTIDESVRLMANSIANFDRPEFKATKNAGQQEEV